MGLPGEQNLLMLSATLSLLLLLPLLVISLLWLFEGTQHDPEAEERARVLLSRLLTKSEMRGVEMYGYLRVSSPAVADREYRIPARGGPVEVRESGRLIRMLCIQPCSPLPPSDVMLVHKLMIEGDEVEYLNRANVVSESHWLPVHM